MKLTVDKNGNDATSASFDPTNIVQWGFDMQYSDNSPLAESSLFGAGLRSWPPTARPLRSRTHVSTGEKWFNDGVWKDHFIPTAAQISSDLLGKGNEFESGNLAMNEIHTWFTCCVYPAAPAKPKIKLRLGRRPVVQRRSPPPSSTPTPSACSTRPSTRTRPSRP